jgi:hypothetical protein
MNPAARIFLSGAIGLLLAGALQTGGAEEPCDPNPVFDPTRGYVSVRKTVHYKQVDDSAPVIDPEFQVVFGSQYLAAADQDVTAVSVTGPTGTIRMINNAGMFLGNRTFTSREALETAFPAGNYTINATGGANVTLTLGNAAEVPVPQLSNFSELTEISDEGLHVEVCAVHGGGLE